MKKVRRRTGVLTLLRPKDRNRARQRLREEFGTRVEAREGNAALAEGIAHALGMSVPEDLVLATQMIMAFARVRTEQQPAAPIVARPFRPYVEDELFKRNLARAIEYRNIEKRRPT